ncbi:hypothetical protein MHYP_G00080560 [Metynnis hypsauchen]
MILLLQQIKAMDTVTVPAAGEAGSRGSHTHTFLMTHMSILSIQPLIALPTSDFSWIQPECKSFNEELLCYSLHNFRVLGGACVERALQEQVRQVIKDAAPGKNDRESYYAFNPFFTTPVYFPEVKLIC